MEKNYTEKIEIWAFGCVFAELQETLKGNVQDYKKRQPLFPGSYCYPLSPLETTKTSSLTGKKLDQLKSIFQILGTQSKENLEFISDENARKYLNYFPIQKPIKFSQLFPGSDENALKILEQTLKFHPEKRPILEEVMTNPYFNDFRKQEELDELKTAEPVIMELEFEKDLTIELLKQYFQEEFSFYSK